MPKIDRDNDHDGHGARWARDGVGIAINELLALKPLTSFFNSTALNINWIIPDFIRGAGGHMTIFRMVHFLEKFGHQQTIWVQNPGIYSGLKATKNAILTWFQYVGANVRVRFLPDDVRAISGDILIATDCWTAYPAANVTNIKERFYFIQDDEAQFHPAGELRLVVEQTYKMGFSALCAGPWLLEKSQARGMWARQWSLCSDSEYYYPLQKSKASKPIKIAFYSRLYTPRRAVNLGIAALELLAKRRSDIQVHLFGGDNLEGEFKFPFTNHGVMSPEDLGHLYRNCDIGVVFSATNYSLIPLEMMVCELPVVELDTESTRAVFTNEEVTFAIPTPLKVADAIERLIDNAELQKAQKEKANAFLADLNWENSARLVEAALIERLKEKSFEPINPLVIVSPAVHKSIKASVVVPTLNAGNAFKTVLERLASQDCSFPYDVLVIDSGSTDGTVEAVKALSNRNIRLHEIAKSEFQHGRTRNLGISMTDGDYVAIITQDALPYDNQWLSALIGGFSKSDRVAGVIGRHLAYPEHSPFTARDLNQMFDKLRDLGECYSISQGLPSFIRPRSMHWQMLLQFYSDNNSAMSRRVWKEYPYPEINWGEDQVLAWEALELGFEKIYVDDARIYHSHAFTPPHQFIVSSTEGQFWGEHFGLQLVGDVSASIAAANANDTAFAMGNQITTQRP